MGEAKDRIDGTPEGAGVLSSYQPQDKLPSSVKDWMRKAVSWKRVCLKGQLGPGRDSQSGKKNQYGLHLPQRWGSRSLAPPAGQGSHTFLSASWGCREERTSASHSFLRNALLYFAVWEDCWGLCGRRQRGYFFPYFGSSPKPEKVSP